METTKQTPYIQDDGRLQFDYHAGQQKAMASEARFILLLAGLQSGKALALDTPIPTPKGFTTMGELSVGDQVLDAWGYSCTVTGATAVQHDRECFEVVFDDGATVVADAEHRWVTQSKKQRKNSARSKDPDADRYRSVRTTKEIGESVTYKYGGANHSVDLPGPAQLEKSDLPIPPYTLGVWLGDGYTDKPNVVISDEEVIEKIESEGVELVYDALQSKRTGQADVFRLGPAGSRGGNDRSKTKWHRLLDEVGVLGEKHVPEIYRTGSPSQRLELLRGLMDSDGYCAKDGQCEFTSMTVALAEAVLELVRSLGIKARLRTGRATYYGKDCGTKYRVAFLPTERVFHVTRKAERQTSSVRADVERRYIREVRPVESVPVRCIEVNSITKQYLVGRSYIPTHNTIFGPWWMLREMQRKGPGDYLVATPTYPLLNVKCLPEYKDLFERRLHLGEYVGSPNRRLTLTARGEQVLFGAPQEHDTRILFGHAQDPDSLESATVKAAHLDEAGQAKFKYGSWDAIQGRLSIHQGRALITTTPYYMGWLKSELYDRADEADDIEVIQFDSTENPAFPQEEFDRQQERLPGWKFRMRYRGMFERPAGMIYDCWNRDTHCIPRHRIGPKWPRHLGLDFGGANTAGVYLARKPGSTRYVLYGSYHAGSRTAAQHARELQSPSFDLVDTGQWANVRGGARSEGQWRSEFRAGGLPVREPPIDDVEVGIDRVYAMLKATADERFDEPHLLVFKDCDAVIDEIESYQRKLDDEDEPTEEIKNKNEYHHMDALRYIVSTLLHTETLPDAPRSRQY